MSYRGLKAVSYAQHRCDSLAADIDRVGYLQEAFARLAETGRWSLQTESRLSAVRIGRSECSATSKTLLDDADGIAARGAPRVAPESVRSNISMLVLDENGHAGLAVRGDMVPTAGVIPLETSY